MDMIISILEKILPVILMPGLGILCRKKGIVQSQGVAALKSIVLKIFVPAVLFRAYYTQSYSLNTLIIALTMFAACLITLSAGFLFKKLFAAHPVTPFIMSSFEAGMLGIALYALWYGMDSVTEFAMVNVGQTVFVWSVYFLVLRRSQMQQRCSLASSLKSMLMSPIMIAILAGILLGASGLGRVIHSAHEGRIFSSLLDFVSAPTAALTLFIVGCDLSLRRENIKTVLPATGGRIIIMALLCVGMLALLGALMPVSTPLRWAILLMFTLPTSFSLVMMTCGTDDSALITTAVSLQTVFALAAFAVMTVMHAQIY